MGYTHYWTQTRDFAPDQMDDIATAVRKIIRKSGTPIRGFDGTGTPELTTDMISFNGDEDNAHGTFYFKAKRELAYPGGTLGWNCCKTAHKPYDVVVVAVLTFLQSDYEFEILSDGDIEEWEAGRKLAEKALGRRFANPLIVEELIR